jgi:hypothetical protein
MYHPKFRIIIVLLIMALALQACALIKPAAPVEPQAPLPPGEQNPNKEQTKSQEPAPEDPSAPDANIPASIALQFFQAYTDAVRSFQPTIGSPNFEAEKHLSRAYIQQLAEIRAGFDGFGFDPVLLAQDVPPYPWEVKEARIDGNQAVVVLHCGAGKMETPFERTVSLMQIDGQWLIVPDFVEDGAGSPGETVEAFYTWYLGYINAEIEPRNPLADRAYRAAPYLDPTLIGRVDRMFDEEGFIGYDPFLCAQDIPSEVKVAAAYEHGARPMALVESSFPGHYFTVDLVRVNFNRWVIRKITCEDSPAGTAKAFYTWTLAYMTAGNEFHNPWVEGAHRQSPFLSQDFIERLDEQLASAEPVLADPVFLAQDLPDTFTTAPCQEAEDCALVNMQYGPAHVRQLKLDLVVEGGRRRIASIQHNGSLEPVEHETWLPLVDEQYGYALRYPAGTWTVAGLNIADQHTPEEYPIMRSLYFKTSESIEITPFSLDVLVWSEQDITGAYYLSELLEKTQVNSYDVLVYRSEPGLIHYVFQHPSRPDLWIILTDSVTQFPNREELAHMVEGIFETIVSTIAFE